MGATWDMYTSGGSTGALIRPLQYTTSEADACRVRVYLQIATPLGTHKFATSEGLNVETILDATTSDDERIAIVRDIVLNDNWVDSITSGPTVTVTDAEVSISVTCLTVDGVEITIGT